MTRRSSRIPISVLVQALCLASIVGIPVLFVAINQVRRACGNSLFGTREHFCSAAEVGSWMLSLPTWIPVMIGAAIVSGVLLVRRFLHKIAS